MKQGLWVALATLMISGTAFAGAAWRESHPRRAEVNTRLANQNARIRQGVRNGTLSKSQAQQLHAEDHAIRQEERGMASQNGGHITKGEQHVLNQQENGVSNQIPPK